MAEIAPSAVPEDFGAENGTPISNKRSILCENITNVVFHLKFIAKYILLILGER
jgi:hypothetical protein